MAPIGRENHDWSAPIGFHAVSSAFSVLIVSSLVLLIWKCACCRQKRRRARGDHDDHRSGTHSGDSVSKGDDDLPEPIKNQKQEKQLVSVIRGRGAKAPLGDHGTTKGANDQAANDSMLPSIMRHTGLSPPPSVHPPDNSELEEKHEEKRRKTKKTEARKKLTRYQKKKPVEVRSVMVGTPMVNPPSASPSPNQSPVQDTRHVQPAAAPKPAKPFVVAKTVRNVRREKREESQSRKQEKEKVRSTSMVSEKPSVHQVRNAVKSIELERIMTKSVRVR